MDVHNLEERVRTLEMAVGNAEKRREDRSQNRKESRTRRRFYFVLSRIMALALAYPFIAGLLWLVGSPRPWIHALAPAITIIAYLFVAPIIQRALLRFAPNAKEE